MSRTYPKFQQMDTSFGSVSIAVTDAVDKTVNELLALIAEAFDTYKAVTTDSIGQATTVDAQPPGEPDPEEPDPEDPGEGDPEDPGEGDPEDPGDPE
jgi:hypothetical protein